MHMTGIGYSSCYSPDLLQTAAGWRGQADGAGAQMARGPRAARTIDA